MKMLNIELENAKINHISKSTGSTFEQKRLMMNYKRFVKDMSMFNAEDNRRYDKN